MSSLVVYRPQDQMAQASSFDLMPTAMELAKTVAATDFVPKPLRNNPPAILAAILAGHEVGLPPMTSLANVHIIEGRPTLAATAMRALILSRGHEIGFEEMTVTRCTVWGRRVGSDKVTKVVWTMDDANRAGLAGKQNWRQHPRAMLIARATGELARAIFADVLGGIPYTREEAEDGFNYDGTDTRPAEAGGAEPPAPTTRRRARRAATAPEPPPDVDIPPVGEVIDHQQEPPAPPPEPPDPSQAPASEPVDERMPLNQQIAMLCRMAGIERSALIFALTSKERGRDLTREEAQEVLNTARAISRGEARLEGEPGTFRVVANEPEQGDPPEPDVQLDNDAIDRALREQEQGGES